jgi:hypothetical protein
MILVVRKRRVHGELRVTSEVDGDLRLMGGAWTAWKDDGNIPEVPERIPINAGMGRRSGLGVETAQEMIGVGRSARRCGGCA